MLAARDAAGGLVAIEDLHLDAQFSKESAPISGFASGYAGAESGTPTAGAGVGVSLPTASRRSVATDHLLDEMGDWIRQRDPAPRGGVRPERDFATLAFDEPLHQPEPDPARVR